MDICFVLSVRSISILCIDIYIIQLYTLSINIDFLLFYLQNNE